MRPLFSVGRHAKVVSSVHHGLIGQIFRITELENGFACWLQIATGAVLVFRQEELQEELNEVPDRHTQRHTGGEVSAIP